MGTDRHLFSSDRQAGIGSSEDAPRKTNTSHLKIAALQEILVVALDRCFLRHRLSVLADNNRITGKEQGIQQISTSKPFYVTR